MKTKGNQRRDSVARSLRRNMDNAAFAAAHYPNRHIEAERARRNGVRPDLIVAYKRYLKRKSAQRDGNPN